MKAAGSNQIFLALALGVAMSGCDGTPDPNSLEDVRWGLVRLGQNATVALALDTEPNLTFNSEDKSVSGSGGCNGISAKYEVDGSELVLSDVVRTFISCPDGTDIEASFFEALEGVSRWDTHDDRLELLDPEGDLLLEFRARPLPVEVN